MLNHHQYGPNREPGARVEVDRAELEERARVLRVGALVAEVGVEAVVVVGLELLDEGLAHLARLTSRGLVAQDDVGEEVEEAPQPSGPPQISGEYIAPVASPIRKS